MTGDSVPRGVSVTASTVRQILTLPSFRDAQLLAGASGLNRMVRSINTMEVPDVLPWTNAGELLLTTGYPMRSNPLPLADFIGELHARGLAGLAIKLGRYIDELPPEMLQRADAVGFPVIQVDDTIAFADMLNQVLLEILGRSASAIEKAERDHQELMQLVLNGEGLPAVIDAVAVQLSAETDTATEVVLALADRTGRFGATSGTAIDLLSDAVCDDDGSFLASVFGHGVHDVGGTSIAVASVKAEGNRGHLVAARRDRPWISSEVITLERGATLAALVLNREAAVTAVEHKYRADLLRDILAGRVPSESVHTRADTFGWELGGAQVVVVAADTPSATTPLEQGRTDLRARAWRSRVRSFNPRAASATFASESVAVFSCAEREPDQQFYNELAQALAPAGKPYDGLIGVSRVVDGAQALPAAYAQAWEAVRVGRMLEPTRTVSRFDDLGLYRLLSWIPDTGELRQFLSDTLGPLAVPEGESETDELRRTLEVLLDTNLNVAETARQMHFHYNTLRYRVNKLEKLLGPFTTDSRLRADLLVALYVWRMRVAHP